MIKNVTCRLFSGLVIAALMIPTTIGMTARDGLVVMKAEARQHKIWVCCPGGQHSCGTTCSNICCPDPGVE